MPNIEVHGKVRQAEFIETIIFDMFSEKKYVDEMVVTTYPTTVVDKNGKNQPFLRLVSSCQEHTEEILEILLGLGMDVECVQLQGFYPKRLVCKGDRCRGEIDFNIRVPLTGTSSEDAAHPCKKCGRVHRENGSQVLSGCTHEVFFKEDQLVKGGVRPGK